MNLLQDLSEARLFGGGKSGIKRYNAKEIADLLFLHMISLQILKSDFYGLPKAQKYVNKSGNLINWDTWSQSKNEIYAMLHILIGKNAQKTRLLLKDQEESMQFLSNIKLNVPHLRKFLRLVITGTSDESFERRFLLELEKNLIVNNSYYRSLRRLASTWNKQPESTKSLVMTRLLQIMRSKGMRSELLPIIEYVSKKERLEDDDLSPLSDEKSSNIKKSEKMGLLKKIGKVGLGVGAGAAAGYALSRNKK